jgi:Flp pilus assembly protein TadB
MGIIFFILIAGAWAAFLLPSFFDHRRDNPSETTRRFAVGKARLGALAGSDEPLAAEYHAARNSQARRQRVFILLLALALVTLVVAVMTASWVWLGVSIAVDVAIGAYVALILYMRQQSTHRQRTVVHLDRTTPHAPTTAEDLDFDAAPPTVRIIGG